MPASEASYGILLEISDTFAAFNNICGADFNGGFAFIDTMRHQ